MEQPKSYTSTTSVYTGGVYYAPGDPFVSAEAPGENWTPIGDAEKAAIQGANDMGGGDPSYEDMSLAALQAIAADKHVTSTGLKKADLITAIKAANEPAL